MADDLKKLLHSVGISTSEYDDEPIELAMPATLQPRAYQLEGARWLKRTGRAILADDAGLGKTLQAAMAATRPVVVTCPTYLVLQWQEFLNTEYPNETVAVAGIGDRRQRTMALTGGNILKLPDIPHADWTIINTDMHRNYVIPRGQTWICDEFHSMRNREAARSKQAFQYAQVVPYVFGLTATPVYKDIGDLWSQLHILDQKQWHSYWQYIQEFAKTGGASGWGSSRIVGIWNPKKLERDIAPYILRRTYADAALDLPDIIDKSVMLQFSDKERLLYNRVRDMFIYEDITLNSASEVMHTLRRCTVPIKIDAAREILADNPDEPTTIFTWYLDTADDLANELGKDNCVVITGQTDSNKRATLAKAALANGKVLIANIAALSEGVDLSACKQVIQLEEDYVPGSMYQERRRFARWTQDQSPVIFHNVRVRNTIDMAVHAAVVSRRGSAQSILKDALT